MLRGCSHPCEQHRNQLRSALSEGDKDLLMEDWLAHISPSKGVRTLYKIRVLSREQGCSRSRFGIKSFEVVHNEYSCIQEDKDISYHLWRQQSKYSQPV